MTKKTRPVICQGCRDKFVRENGNFEKDSKGYWHKTCYQAKKQEQAEREDLLTLARTHIGETANPAFIQKQINKFTKEYGYTVSGIKGTIYYAVEVKRMKLRPEFGLAFVPYNYEKARAYFEKMDSMESIEPYKELEVRVIEIPVPEGKRYRRSIDLDTLFDEGEL